MRNQLSLLVLFIIFTLGLNVCTTKKDTSLDMNNLYAWCIVPFDNQHRTPTERIDMLKTLGFTSYAYDWRQEHLPEMATEFQLAKENNIHIEAVWMWIDVTDTVGKLSPDNEQVFQIMEDSGIQTQLWIGISEAYFGNLSDDSCMVKAEAMIRYLSKRVVPFGGKIGLYNHGGWFGNPINEVRLIKAIPDQNLGIIFNFHHAHELLGEYPELVDIMMPYLWAVNLDGMRVEGPKILPIGAGDKEREMIQILKEKGFNGPYGILGHTEDADVKVILQGNLDGLKKILAQQSEI